MTFGRRQILTAMLLLLVLVSGYQVVREACRMTSAAAACCCGDQCGCTVLLVKYTPGPPSLLPTTDHSEPVLTAIFQPVVLTPSVLWDSHTTYMNAWLFDPSPPRILRC